MFCPNCGTENDNDSLFCRGCGGRLTLEQGDSTPVQPANQDNYDDYDYDYNPTPAANPYVRPAGGGAADFFKKIPIWAYIAAGATVLLLLVGGFFLFKASRTLDLNDYVVVETTGYDGYGNASVNIDWDSMSEKYKNRIGYTSEARKQYGSWIKNENPVSFLREYVRINTDNSNDLSNGDVVKYEWNVNEDLFKYINFNIKYEDGEHKVEGLEEIGTFDAFADFDVEFTGTAPYGYASINYLGDELYYGDFNIDRTSGLSNGEKVKVTIDRNRIQYIAESLGKVPAQLEKEFTVSGLESYVKKLSEIDDASLNQMKMQASDEYNSYVASRWGDGESVAAFDYIGSYLLTSKTGGNNLLYLVYKVQVSNYFANENGSYSKINNDYWYVRYDDLMLDGDGNLKFDVTRYYTPSNTFQVDSGVDAGWWSTKTWNYTGYPTLSELYKNAVTTYIADFNHEDNVDESNVETEAPAAAPAPVEEAEEDDFM